ncbi:MAG: hypothetical protein U5L96_06175 [Owenweeksia sp.]|nr:hypothetical protein [Owenweeksia sp.]
MKYIAQNGLLKEDEVAETVIFADNAPMIRYAETSTERKDRLGLTLVCHFGHNYVTYTLPAKALKGKNESIISVRNATS